MATTETTIINMAIYLVGGTSINATTDSKKTARVADDLYEPVRNAVFDMAIDWKFATTRKQLSENSNEPDFGYDHQYNMPANGRRIISMVNEDDDTIEFEWRREVYIDDDVSPPREYDVILTNEDTVRVKYIYLRRDPAKWPGWFVNLVATNLAVWMSQPLKQSKQDREQLRSMRFTALEEALEGNGSEDVDINVENERLDKGSTEVIEAARNGFVGATRSNWGRRIVS
jgi:hypothetical protein